MNFHERISVWIWFSLLGSYFLFFLPTDSFYPFPWSTDIYLCPWPGSKWDLVHMSTLSHWATLARPSLQVCSSIMGILISNKLLSIFFLCLFIFNPWKEKWLDLQRCWKFSWLWPHSERTHYLLEKINQINICSHKTTRWHIASYIDLSKRWATINSSICKM